MKKRPVLSVPATQTLAEQQSDFTAEGAPPPGKVLTSVPASLPDAAPTVPPTSPDIDLNADLNADPITSLDTGLDTDTHHAPEQHAGSGDAG